MKETIQLIIMILIVLTILIIAVGWNVYQYQTCIELTDLGRLYCLKHAT